MRTYNDIVFETENLNEACKELNEYDRGLYCFEVSQELLKVLKDARNELCSKCGKFKNSHNGACNGCKWSD